MSRDSSIGMGTDYGLDARGSNPGKGKIFLFYTASEQALGPTQPPIKWVPGDLFLGVKRPRHAADHSPPSNAEVTNGGTVPPLLHAFMAWCLIN
jgi:hypothetical protein